MVGTLRRGFQALLVVDMVLATQECRFAKHSPILHVYFVCFRHISMRQQDRDREQGGVREDVRLPCRTGCREWGQPGFGPLTGVSRQVVQLSLEWEGLEWPGPHDGPDCSRPRPGPAMLQKE